MRASKTLTKKLNRLNRRDWRRAARIFSLITLLAVKVASFRSKHHTFFALFYHLVVFKTIC